jgi:hypothetical protein
MSKPTTLQRHIAAIQAGEVERTNIIGIRKALNADARKREGFSTSATSPKISDDDLAQLMFELDRNRPKVVGALHDSGLKLLRDRRYAKRLADYADIIEWPSHFELWDWMALGRWGQYHVPIYRLVGQNGGAFKFYNIPWQSGGNGPEIIR